jgi:hypothetical protein
MLIDEDGLNANRSLRALVWDGMAFWDFHALHIVWVLQKDTGFSLWRQRFACSGSKQWFSRH